ncbi:MAG TPA: hypothetical protein VFY87_01120 [Geminicoccaceae bacterium]|nr:hypothetical protein [Geminicoccaceae bacterium]
MSGDGRPRLTAIVADELAAPVDPAVQAVAAAARAAHGDAVSAVLFYGSCRRDGYREGMLVDLYVLVDAYAAVHRSRLMRRLNWLMPPNVYYAEAPRAGATVRAKYALVSLDQFERRMRFSTSNPYFWARFAQPTGLVWARDARARAQVTGALAQAIATTERATRPLLGDGADALDLWTLALRESYRTELRVEKPHRARAIVEDDRERWRRVDAALAAGEGERATETRAQALRHWRRRRVEGKALSVLRLVKASFTFAGGADYIAWKISRHAGAPVEFRAWERRHPLLAAPVVLWRLARRGIIR